MMGALYRTTSPSGRSYIGITAQEPETRTRKGAAMRGKKRPEHAEKLRGRKRPQHAEWMRDYWSRKKEK